MADVVPRGVLESVLLFGVRTDQVVSGTRFRWTGPENECFHRFAQTLNAQDKKPDLRPLLLDLLQFSNVRNHHGDRLGPIIETKVKAKLARTLKELRAAPPPPQLSSTVSSSPALSSPAPHPPTPARRVSPVIQNPVVNVEGERPSHNTRGSVGGPAATKGRGQVRPLTPLTPPSESPQYRHDPYEGPDSPPKPNRSYRPGTGLHAPRYGASPRQSATPTPSQGARLRTAIAQQKAEVTRLENTLEKARQKLHSLVLQQNQSPTPAQSPGGSSGLRQHSQSYAPTPGRSSPNIRFATSAMGEQELAEFLGNDVSAILRN